MSNLDSVTKKNLDFWLKHHPDSESRTLLEQLYAEQPSELVDAFYATIHFGTAGLRGLMGVGTNRLNSFTIGLTTQALANDLRLAFPEKKDLSVFIGYDSRHQSREFAEEVALILAGNEIKAYISEEIIPTPLVSFGCRFLGCDAAVMITASHNPPQYNGYKVYWTDGGQVLPPHDVGIMKQFQRLLDHYEIERVDDLDNPKIEWVDDRLITEYLRTIYPLQSDEHFNRDHGKELSIVYTSLHGTGIQVMPRALHGWGFTKLSLVAVQCIPDGDFPTAPSPNPEQKAAMAMGIDQMVKNHADLFLATDPDADRLGVAYIDQGKPYTLGGNEILCLLVEHVLSSLDRDQGIPQRAACVKTIVSSELFRAVCDHYRAECFDVLTGFKYIAQLIESWESNPEGRRFLFGGEESYGSLRGTQVRDKDAILSGCLVAEMTLRAKVNGKTLKDLLHDLYKKYGVYRDYVESVNFPETKEGKESMIAMMKRLREDPPRKLLESRVITVEDYAKGERLLTEEGEKSPLTLPKTDLLIFQLADKTRIMVRPSGTEPKVKIYCEVVEEARNGVEEAIDRAEKRSRAYTQALLTGVNS